MDANPLTQSAANEDFDLKVKALIKSREQLKEQNSLLEKKIKELEALSAAPKTPEPPPSQPASPEFVQPPQPQQTPPGFAFRPQIPYEPRYTLYQPAPVEYPYTPDPHPLYPRRTDFDRFYADAQAQAQLILDEAYRKADAVFAEVDLTSRAVFAEILSALSATQKNLDDALALFSSRQKIIADILNNAHSGVTKK